jgi:hypothetical protein
MMGDTRKPEDIRNSKNAEKGRPNPHDSTHDPEFEMPDPEQVERDIEQAERLYREDEKKKPAA